MTDNQEREMTDRQKDLGTLAKDFAAAQLEMPHAKINRVNPHFKSKYADLPAVIDAVRPALAKYGFAFTQTTENDGNGLALRTRLLHVSGESIESVWPLTMESPQKMGSQLTYARRYCLAAICGISADDDDDGNGAEEKEEKKTTTPKITAEQAAIINTLIDEVGANREGFLSYLQVPSVDQIPAGSYDFSVNALEKKRGKK